MNFTFYGHACFSVETKGKTILFDPFISPNPKAAAIDIKQLKADFILLSHGHEDHIADAEVIAKNTNATIVSNYEIVTWYQKKGLEKLHPMNLGGSWKFDFGTVKYTTALHSSMLPDGSYGGNPGGFLVKNDEISFYYTGDTALTMDMKLIGETEKLDFAVLPIGDNFTMGINDAIIAADFMKCNKIIGIHYDTFGYIEINHQEAIDKFKAKGKELILLKIGGSVNIKM
ncbi:MAG: metal-dependent hydrolase [Vicingaceae bacterium]|nr:metal-dependent hydrolase [Vicingaceae bacterium]